MDLIAIQTLLIAIVVGISCGLMGVFLILRRMSMMVDAISHTVLLGIVLSYMVTKDLSSPWLMVGATIMGVLTVVLIELLVSTKRTSADAATGTIFPFLFSIAVILITTRFSSTHLDSHAINGNLEFAAFEQLELFGRNVGSKTLFISTVILLLLIVIIVALYRNFKITIFDYDLAKTLGLAPLFIHYLMMSMTSLTAVSSFNAVGSILVVAMMIGPAASALLITKRLSTALLASGLIASFNAATGYFTAMYLFSGQVNIASTIATITFITFLLIWITEPNKGLLTSLRRRKIQERDILTIALFTHLKANASVNTSLEHLSQDLDWSEQKLKRQLNRSIKKGYIRQENKSFRLSNSGVKHMDLLFVEYTKNP